MSTFPPDPAGLEAGLMPPLVSCEWRRINEELQEPSVAGASRSTLMRRRLKIPPFCCIIEGFLSFCWKFCERIKERR